MGTITIENSKIHDWFFIQHPRVRERQCNDLRNDQYPGKAYKQYPTRWARLAEWMVPPFSKPRHRPKQVLQDINFTVRALINLNPMVHLVGALQGTLVAGQWPAWQSLLPVTLLAIAMCALGMRLFRKHAGEMVDEL